jgi:hypothetical protein
MVLTSVTFLILGINLSRTVSTQPLLESPERENTYSFSLIALSFPNLLQNSSKVASSAVCSLTLQCQGAPSPGPFGCVQVLTVLWWYDFPCFHDFVDSRISRPAVKIDSADGISISF